MGAEPWLRRVMLGLAAATYLGAAVELVLVEHYGGVWQLAPFAMIVAGLAAVARAWQVPTAHVRLLTVVGAVVVLGSVLGVYFHVEANWAFAVEVRPRDTVAEHVWDALSGVNPLLAPGMIGLAGVLGAAAGATPRAPRAQLSS